MDEPLVEGVYKSLLDYLQISPKRDSNSMPIGRYMKDDTFVVFKVFPEEKGIVWGMVSSNVDGLGSKFVPLRVNNHPKVILMKRFEDTSQLDLISALRALGADIRDLTNAIRSKS
jgi:hypothetical protein